MISQFIKWLRHKWWQRKLKRFGGYCRFKSDLVIGKIPAEELKDKVIPIIHIRRK